MSRPPNTLQQPNVQWIEVDAPEGHKLLAAIFRPPGPGPFPVVVLLHSSGGFSEGVIRTGNTFFEAGFLVVAGCWFAGYSPRTGPSFRPIECHEGPAFAGANTNSIKYADAIVKIARVLPGADGQRIGLFGQSRGATAAILLASTGRRVQAVVADSAGYTLEGLGAIDTAPIGLVQKLNAPLLMLHGTADATAPVRTAREYEAALRQFNKPYEVHYYEGAPHVVTPGNTPYSADAMARAIAFLKNNLTSQATPTPSPAPTPTPTPAPTPTPLPGPYYIGPLFDTHIHLGPSVAGSRAPLKSADALVRYFDRNQEVGAIGFFPFPPDPAHQIWAHVSPIIPIATGARHRVIPLLSPWPPGDWAQGRFSEAFLRGYLQPQGPFHGVGEFCFYCKDFQTVTFESPLMQTLFQLVNPMKGIVYSHFSFPASFDPARRKTELAELEPSIRKFPDVLFVNHGGPDDFSVVAPLMSKYPNVYFTMDINPWLFTGPLTGWKMLMEPEKKDLTSGGSTEQFLAEVNRIGIDRLIESGLSRALPLIREYPDRIMWGTDRGSAWHFEDATTDLIIQASRQFIARLPAEIQEKYAYRTAQRVFGRFLSPGP